MSDDTQEEGAWYLKDEPLPHLREEDRFSHRAYVRVLVQAIKEVKPPFTLGVFGSWGVGKTSIINDLKGELKEEAAGGKTVAVHIDVWKYQGDSLRRQFLCDLQDELKRHSGVLDNNYDKVDELFRQETTESSTPPRLDWARFKTMAPTLLGAGLAAFAVIFAVSLLVASTAVQALVSAAIVPIVLMVFSELSRSVVVYHRGTITRPLFLSADQFERAFKEILNDAKCDRVVVVVDNLDRCPHDLVVDTLSSVKTFLEPKGQAKCLFVIPCDDEAIRQHVKAAYRNIDSDGSSKDGITPDDFADEYLRKFFTGSIRIDRFLGEEIELYVEYLLGRIKLTEDMAEEEFKTLVQMVGFLFSENPRQIKQFLNNLTSKYLLAQERESGESPQISPPISDQKLFLAKVAAIEARFPVIYNKFLQDDNLFPEIEHAATNPDETGEVSKRLGNEKAGLPLERFLRSFGHVTAGNPKAFFHLKQSPDEARIPNYSQFDAALKGGDVEAVTKAYEEGDADSNVARTQVLASSIGNWAYNGYPDYALNAVRIASVLQGSTAADGQRLSREVIRALATAPSLLGSLQRIRNAGAIMAMTDHAISENRNAVLNRYIDLYVGGPGSQPSGQDNDVELQDTIAKALVEHVDKLTEAQKMQVRSATSGWDTPRFSLLEALTAAHVGKTAFVDSVALRKLLGGIRAEDLDEFAKSKKHMEHHPAVLVLTRCQDIAGQEVATEAADKIEELLEYATSQNSEELFWYLAQGVEDLSSMLGSAERKSVDKIHGHLYRKYQSADPDQKINLAGLLCRFHPKVSDGEKNNAINILTSDSIPSLPAANVSELLALHKYPNYSAAPWDQMRRSLAQRLAAEANVDEAKKLLRHISSALTPEDNEHLAAIIVEILKRPETQQAVQLADEALQDLPRGNRGKSLLAPVLEATLSTSDQHAQPENKKLLLDFAFNHKDWHTKDFADKLDSHLKELITGGDPLRQAALQATESAYSGGALPEGRYISLLQDFADWVVQQPATTPLQSPIPKWLERVISLKEQVLGGGGRRERMIRWLAARQEESLPSEERQQTLQHLVSFSEIPRDVLEALLSKLVYQAQNVADEQTREIIVDGLITLYRRNNPLNEEIWSDLRDGRRALRNADDDNKKKLGNKLYREMRKIRREGGQPKTEDADQAETEEAEPE